MKRNSLRVADAVAKKALLAIVRSELLGLPLSEPGRSLPSILLLRFGKLRAIKYITSPRPIQRGDCNLLVEAADWCIMRGAHVLATNESAAGQIDTSLEALSWKIVREVILDDTAEFRIRLSDDFEILMSICESEIDDSQWTFFRAEQWSLAAETDGTLIIEA